MGSVSLSREQHFESSWYKAPVVIFFFRTAPDDVNAIVLVAL